MGTERLDIAVRQKGAKKVSRDIKEIGTSAKTANKGVALLTAGIAGIAALGIAKQVIGLANTYAQLSNKVKVAVGEQGDYNGTLKDLFSIADRTRAPIEAITTLYQRGALAANELGASQQQLLDFTENVGTALALQGGAASEASGALLQLSQSLGSGVVRAEEFNSILEGAFPIALAAAKGIDEAGGSVAKLRNLIIKGKITSDVFFKGLLSQGDDLQRQFKQVAPTVDQAMTRIKNAFIQAAGGGNLDPLVDSLNEFADLINDPQFQQGFASFVSGVVSMAGTAVTLASEFGILGKELGFIAAAATGNVTELDDLAHSLEGVQKAIKAEELGGFSGFLIKPIAFTGDSIEELQAEEARIKAEIERINTGLGFIKVDKPDAGPAGTASISEGAGPDPKLVARQAQFLAGLKTSNEELAIQVRLGEAAAGALARYSTEQEIIALQLSPAQAAAARDLTEAMIAQNNEIERQSELAEQTDFIVSLEQQEERLRITGEAGDDAAAALLLYETRLQAIATGGGPEFVALALDIAEGINAQTEALEAQERARGDQDLIQDLQMEASLIGLTNRERSIELATRRLSADATAEQVKQVQDLAGALFDEGEALRRAAITFDEFLKENARAIQQTLSGALSNALTDGFDDLPSQFAKVLQQLASQYLASGIFKALSQIGQQDGAGAFAQGIGDFFAGGFATGGQFNVPGSGGTDSQLVSFRATPGERVSVETPGQQRAGKGGGSNFAPPNVNVSPTIINTIDESEITGAFQEGAGDSVLLNRISVRRNAFRRALGL